MIHKDYLSTHIVTFFSFKFKKMRFDSVFGDLLSLETRQDNGKLLKYLDLIWSRPVFVMSDTFLVCRPMICIKKARACVIVMRFEGF